MALPITAKPTFPLVPLLPGVPPVLRPVGFAQNELVLVASDAEVVLNQFLPPQWGLFTSDGTPAFSSLTGGGIGPTNAFAQVVKTGGQSVVDVEYKLDHRIATAPQEQGAFLSYNKVSTPFSGRVTYVISGTNAQRGAFLLAVLNLQASLTLLTLAMPEYQYQNCNIVHHDFRRTAQKGVSMFMVDIWVEQVRISGPPAYSNTKNASGQDATNGGTVSPATPTSAQSASSVPLSSAGPTNGY